MGFLNRVSEGFAKSLMTEPELPQALDPRDVVLDALSARLAVQVDHLTELGIQAHCAACDVPRDRLYEEGYRDAMFDAVDALIDVVTHGEPELDIPSFLQEVSA